MKNIIYFFAALILTSCANSDSGAPNAGDGSVIGNSSSVQDSIKQVNIAFNTVARSISSGSITTFSENAPVEMRINCDLKSTQAIYDDGITVENSQVYGDECPVDFKRKFVHFGSGGAQISTKWSNSYIFKSEKLKEAYGFSQVIENVSVSRDRVPGPENGKYTSDSHINTDEFIFVKPNNERIVLTLSEFTINKTNPLFHTSGSSETILVNGQSLKHSRHSMYKYDQNGNVIDYGSTLEFFMNDHKISDEEYKKTGADKIGWFPSWRDSF